MPLKKDAAGNRYVEMELELPGTPEQIWQAVATGPGNTAWFTETSLDEHEGGKITFFFMPGVTSSGTVTAWQPPHRFAYEEAGWSGEAPPVATEITITAHSGGTCTMRMVHSLFTDRADWDDELASFEKGWPSFFRILRLYLQHGAGMRPAASQIHGNHAGSVEGAWAKLAGALSLESAKAGDVLTIRASNAGHLTGTVEYITQQHHEVLLRLSEPSAGAAMFGCQDYGSRVHVAINLRFYGDDAGSKLQHETRAWEAWMAANFPAAA